jgi:hypothetical protein
MASMRLAIEQETEKDWTHGHDIRIRIDPGSNSSNTITCVGEAFYGRDGTILTV